MVAPPKLVPIGNGKYTEASYINEEIKPIYIPYHGDYVEEEVLRRFEEEDCDE